jgi:conjugative transfer region protein TrbK
MDFKILTRGLAYVALAGALVAATTALNTGQQPNAQASKTEPPPTPGGLENELERCKAIDTQAADDAVCKVIWHANRQRFFQSRKLYQDRLTDTSPGASAPGLPRNTVGQPQ